MKTTDSPVADPLSKKNRKYRHYMTILGLFACFVLGFITDPDTPRSWLSSPLGSTVVFQVKAVVYSCMGAAALYLARLALFDWLDVRALYVKALEDKQGGLLAIAVALTLLAAAILTASFTNLV